VLGGGFIVGQNLIGVRERGAAARGDRIKGLVARERWKRQQEVQRNMRRILTERRAREGEQEGR
jgi:hypothetical protein